MELSGVQSGASQNRTGGASGALSDLTSDDFLSIVLAELNNQDPLAPNDTQAMVEQFSSLYQIQSQADLSDSLGTLVRQNELSSASGMIGRIVSGLTDEGARAVGAVLSVSATDRGAVLNLADGSRLPASRIDEVTSADILTGGRGG